MKSRLRRLQDMRDKIEQLRDKYVEKKDGVLTLIHEIVNRNEESSTVEVQEYHCYLQFIEELDEVLKDE